MSDPNTTGGQQQTDPASAYSQLDQGQKATVAQQFIDRFRNGGHPKDQQYAQVDPNAVTAGQLAEMHQHAAENHPGVIGEVMQHPVITAALGGFAAYEIHKHMTKDH